MFSRKTYLLIVLVVILAAVITASASGGEKITICHRERTMQVSENAWPGHQRHGDFPWACELTQTRYIPMVIAE